MKFLLPKFAIAVFVSLCSIQLIFAQCNAPNYAAGTTYATGQQVPSGGKLYRCDVGGWCSSASAYYYAPGTGTAWTTAWTEISVCGTTQIPVLTTIGVTPATGSVASGSTLQFTAAGKDQSGTAFAITPIWTVSGGGSISSSGVFTASTAGTFTVTAKSGTVSGTASITVTSVVNPVLTSITVSPATGSVASGSALQFSAAGKDQNGAAFAITPTWTVSGGGSISSSGLFTANTAGTFTVTAKSGTVSGTASVTVTNVVNPVLTSITVSPATGSVASGSTLQFTAAGTDQNGAAFSITPIWTVSGGGSVSSTGLFTANTAGTFTVTAKSGTVSGTASVTVTAAGNCNAPTYAAGTAYAANQQVANNTKLYRCDVAGWCSSTASGYYAPGTGSAWTSAWTEIGVCGTTQNPVLTTITLSPATGSVASGSTLQFSAAGKDQNGAAFTITPMWTISGGGSISSTGLFTANTTGTFTVTAKSGTVSGTASVTVTSVVQNPVLTTITVSPATGSVASGSTLQFSAAGKDQNGSAFTIAPTWTVSGGGSISSTGLFTANAAGTFTVTAKSGTVSGTANVTVTTVSGSNDISSLITQAQFNQMFMNINDAACDGQSIYTYANFIQAVKSIATHKSPVDYGLFAAEGTDVVRKRELIAFLANAAHETTGGWATAPNGGPYAWGLCFKEERGYQNGQIGYTSVDNPNYLPVAGQSYHGRGPLQISYPVNYGQFSEFLYGTKTTLLNNPAIVATDGVVSFESALWFWMTPQSPKPSAHDVMVGKWTPTSSDISKGRSAGFGMTINIINGGVECGSGSEASQVTDRIGFYTRFAGIMGVSYDLDGTNSTAKLGCANMTNYSGGARVSQFDGIDTRVFGVNAYPNPTTDILNLDFNIVTETAVEISLKNTMGQALAHYSEFYTGGNHVKTIDLSPFPAGVYFLNVVSEAGNEMLKIEKMK